VLRQIQQETHEWRIRNFALEHRSAPLQVLGVCEEAGELSHAVLKDVQGIRGTHAEHVEEARDAMGDIVIYLCGVADAMGLDLQECVESAWNEVRQRDWQKNKDTGVEQPPPVVPTEHPSHEELLQAQIDDPQVDSENLEALEKAKRALRPDDQTA
jgi:NTP pyrophosphatase (non-canonical NTP hydrolase)